MTNGSYYTDVLCGPRTVETLNMPFAEWASRYKAGYAEFDPELVEAYAAKMRQRAEELGGAAGGQKGEEVNETANAWFERKETLPYDEQAAQFTFMMCRMMREYTVLQEDESPQKYSDHAVDSISYITSKWAWDSCRRFRHEVFGAISRAAHDTALEISMCLEGKVQCKKDEEHCLGICAGDETSNLLHDFSTMVALAELNPDVLGEDGYESAHANCTVNTDIIEVQLFDGGESFQTFAARLRVRSGMTALSDSFCEENPLSCGIIQVHTQSHVNHRMLSILTIAHFCTQRTLERAPGLVFVPGVGFRHRFDMVRCSPCALVVSCIC